METTPTPTDREAFEALVLRHQTAICAIAYAVLRDRARSEEVVQDALLIAWRDRAKSSITPGWLCGIARNLARNAARRRREVTMDREPPGNDRDVRDALIAHEDSARATAALARLPDKYRDAIAVYYRSNESYAEVAAALEITEASARQRVHRGRERLQERLSIVETALRATRPGKAFTAGVVAAWALGRAPSADAATVAATKPAWLLPALGLGAIASTIGVAALVHASSAGGDPARDAMAITGPRDTRTTTARRFPLMSSRTGATSAPVRPALPTGFTPAGTPTTAPVTSNVTIDVDFQQAPFDHLMQMIAHESQTPIWSTIDPPRIDIRAKHEPVLDVLDRILSQAHATRTEVEAIRIVERGQHGAAVLGGERMSVSVRDLPINRLLELVEPKLAIPIARYGLPFRVINNGQVIEDQAAPVTLELVDVPAGLVLQRALEQTGMGYELTTGFVITPE